MIDELAVEMDENEGPAEDRSPERSRRLERQRRALLAVAALLALLLVGILASVVYLSRPLEPVDQPKAQKGWTFLSTFSQWGVGPADNLVTPSGIAYAPDGRIVVSDVNKGPRILVFEPPSRTPRLVFGKYGSKPGEIGGAWDVAVDEEGNIYVADSANSRVQVFDSSGERVREIPSRRPQAVFIREDKLYVGEEGSVGVFSLKGDRLSRFGQFGREEGQFDRIAGLFVDETGRIFVADGPLNRVQALDSTGKVLWVAGKPPASMNDMDRTFDFAADLVLAEDGRLYVLEGLGCRVTVLDAKSGKVLEELSERGQEDGQLYQPRKMALSPEGDVIAVTDTFNQRVQLIRLGEPTLADRLLGPRQAFVSGGWLDPVFLCGLPLALVLLVLAITFVLRRVAKSRSETYASTV